MEFFVNPEDLKGWVINQPSSGEAAMKIQEIIGKGNQADIEETCKSIKDNEDEKAQESAAMALYGILAKHNLVRQIKIARTANMEKKDMNKTAKTEKANPTTSPESRQRNDWVRGARNKFNRVVDGFNEGTPWRIDRDKFFNFTHYYTDAVSFDEDPNRVYSGEAIWRMYIMDKFTNEYMNKEGKWVGGYINDRFYVFPDAGTPANPDAPRDGGNQMGLPPGVKSRKPRPHQYSTERRLEIARGNEDQTYDLEAFTSKINSMVKIASNDSKKTIEAEKDSVYGIFKDTLDMREAGINYETMLESVAEHYNTNVLNVAQIDKIAQGLKNKHAGIGYEMVKMALGTNPQPTQPNQQTRIVPNGNYTVNNQQGIKTADGKLIPYETELRATQVPNQFVIEYHPSENRENETVTLANIQPTDLVPAGSEVGLIGDETTAVSQNPQQETSVSNPTQTGAGENFPVNEVPQEAVV